MKYLDKSFSVSMSNVSQDTWDRIFSKKDETHTPIPEAGETTVTVGGTEDAPAVAPEPDFSDRQCAACLERGQMELVAEGLLQCGICLARFPLGVEQAQKVTGESACINCSGTGRLRTTFTVFACGECGGTGARKP
jgi:ribosomal protein L37AE/L43A